MTAPLPPLPKQYKVLIEQSDESGVWTKQHIAVWRIRDMQSYAKLAVREALERAASKIQADLREAEQTWQPHRTIADQAFIDAKSQAVQDIRAMLKEYSDD